MANDREITLAFEGVSPSEANNLAIELKDSLEEAAIARGVMSAASIGIVRGKPEYQDFGATLILALGTPAVLAVAKGVHDFIAKRGSRVVIKHPSGSVIATGDAARNIDIAKTVKALEALTRTT